MLGVIAWRTDRDGDKLIGALPYVEINNLGRNSAIRPQPLLEQKRVAIMIENTNNRTFTPVLRCLTSDCIRIESFFCEIQ